MSLREKIAQKIKIESLPRAQEVSNRLVVLALGGRFMDELLSGLPLVLMPTIRAQFRLSYTQVSLLQLSLNYVAAIIEPINGLLIDIWKRPWLMAFGAAGIGLSTAVIGLAPTFVILMVGFAIYGLASGPLAHTADVVLVEAYPQAPDRIFTRATLLDTTGALLAPLLVSLTIWLGLPWGWLLVALGFSSFIYAFLILRTKFPRPLNAEKHQREGFRRALRENVSVVLKSRRAMTWLLFLLVLAIFETPLQFTTIWLREQVGMSQAVIGLYRAFELGISVISLVVLDRWLGRSNYRRILLIVSFAILLIFPAWLLLPGIGIRFVLALPLSFLGAVYWPVAKGQSLASVPGRGGTITAMESLIGFIPLSLLFGLLAESVTLTKALFWVVMTALVLMILIVWRMPNGARDENQLT